jgi:hypothetical protein
MANRSDNNAAKTTRELGEILDRIDRLPVLDNRSPDKIVCYDENGIPAPVTPSASAAPPQCATDSVEDPDMEDWRKTFGHKIPATAKEFLESRHREWELGMEADLKARQQKRAKRTPKP